MKSLISSLVALALSAMAVTSATAQSFPFSGPSSLPGGPDRLTFGLFGPLCDDCRTVAGGGGPEDILVGNPLGLLLAATWLGAVGSASSAPSLGELTLQAKNNLQAPWLGFTAFFTFAIMLSLLVFVFEGVRDAFDPRKTFT